MNRKPWNKVEEYVSDTQNPTSISAGTVCNVAIYFQRLLVFPVSKNPILVVASFKGADIPLQNHNICVSRAQKLKELQPALSSISKLCLEPHLEKIAIRV
jgi:hypothetical protein